MSARYSNTSSRGLEIVVSTVNGSTVGDSKFASPDWASRRAMIGQAHGVPELGSVHDLRAQERLGIEHRPECSALCRGFLPGLGKAPLNASNWVRNPSREGLGPLTQGISWLQWLVP